MIEHGTRDPPYDRWVEFMAKQGRKVAVADPDDAKHADILVCRLVTDPLLFPDNLVAPLQQVPAHDPAPAACSRRAEQALRGMRDAGGREARQEGRPGIDDHEGHRTRSRSAHGEEEHALMLHDFCEPPLDRDVVRGRDVRADDFLIEEGRDQRSKLWSRSGSGWS